MKPINANYKEKLAAILRYAGSKCLDEKFLIEMEDQTGLERNYIHGVVTGENRHPAVPKVNVMYAFVKRVLMNGVDSFDRKPVDDYAAKPVTPVDGYRKKMDDLIRQEVVLKRKNVMLEKTLAYQKLDATQKRFARMRRAVALLERFYAAGYDDDFKIQNAVLAVHPDAHPVNILCYCDLNFVPWELADVMENALNVLKPGA